MHKIRSHLKRGILLRVAIKGRKGRRRKHYFREWRRCNPWWYV